jgi:putative transposase
MPPAMVRVFTNQLTPQTTPNQLLLNLHTFQKLNYIHNNPIAEHWQLVNDLCMYLYSTCKYYETGENNYTFIKDLRNEF